MMSLSLVLASWITRLAAGYLHCCRSSADLLSWLLSARRPHLQIVLGPLALSPTMVTCFHLSAAHTHARWSTKRLGSLRDNAAIDSGSRNCESRAVNPVAVLGIHRPLDIAGHRRLSVDSLIRSNDRRGLFPMRPWWAICSWRHSF